MANYYGALQTEILHPFGRAGSATTATLSTGVQWGNTVSTPNATTTALSTTYATVETVTIPVPVNGMIKELEIGLTLGVYIISTTTDTIRSQVVVADSGGTTYDTLLISTDDMTATTGGTLGLTEYTRSKRATPSDGTYFTGKGPFDVLCQIKCSATTSKAAGAVKNSSYVLYSYYLVG